MFLEIDNLVFHLQEPVAQCPSQSQGQTCRRSSNPADRFSYCRHCHVLLPSELAPAGTHYIRTEEFVTPAFPHVDPNTLLENLLSKQSLHRYYNAGLAQSINRIPLVAWIKLVCRSLNYSPSCYFQAVAIFDAILSLYAMRPDNMQALAFVSVYVASKTSEPEERVLPLANAVELFYNEFTEAQFAALETFVVKLFGWNLNLRTPLTFLHFFFARGIVSSADLPRGPIQQRLSLARRVQNRAVELLELSLADYGYYKYTSLAVAAAAVAASRRLSGLATWNEDLEGLTRISLNVISECVNSLYLRYRCGREDSTETVADILSEQEQEQDPEPALPLPPVADPVPPVPAPRATNAESLRTPLRRKGKNRTNSTRDKTSSAGRSSVKKSKIAKRHPTEEGVTGKRLASTVSVNTFSFRGTSKKLAATGTRLIRRSRLDASAGA